MGWEWGWAGYSQGGDSRGLAQVCDKAKVFEARDGGARGA